MNALAPYLRRSRRGKSVAALLLAVLFTIGDLQSVILQWSFMSMGLRGAVMDAVIASYNKTKEMGKG